jgi:hypothetical protein
MASVHKGLDKWNCVVLNNTLETSGEDAKIHPKRVKKRQNPLQTSGHIVQGVHPCIVSLYRSFFTREFLMSNTTASFQEGSLVFVYDYVHGANTLEDVMFKQPLAESDIWVRTSPLVLELLHSFRVYFSHLL